MQVLNVCALFSRTPFTVSKQFQNTVIYQSIALMKEIFWGCIKLALKTQATSITTRLMNVPMNHTQFHAHGFHHHSDQCTCYKGVDATVYNTPLLPITCESFTKRWLARFLSIWLLSRELSTCWFLWLLCGALSLSGCFFCLLGTMGGGFTVESAFGPLLSLFEWVSWIEDLLCAGGTTALFWAEGAARLGSPLVGGALLWSRDCLIALGLLVM